MRSFATRNHAPELTLFIRSECDFQSYELTKVTFCEGALAVKTRADAE